METEGVAEECRGHHRRTAPPRADRVFHRPRGFRRGDSKEYSSQRRLSTPPKRDSIEPKKGSSRGRFCQPPVHLPPPASASPKDASPTDGSSQRRLGAPSKRGFDALPISVPFLAETGSASAVLVDVTPRAREGAASAGRRWCRVTRHHRSSPSLPTPPRCDGRRFPDCCPLSCGDWVRLRRPCRRCSSRRIYVNGASAEGGGAE